MVEQLLENIPPAPWIILFSPLVATVAILLFAMRRPKLAANLSLAGILISLALSVFMFLFHIHNHFLPAEDSVSWIRIAGLTVDFGYYIDRLTLLMLLIVTGVGSCIFFYSIGYMHGDSSFPRYFASLSLFAFSMIGIVLSNNFLQLFVFWELVAVSSYLLIGFWFEKPSAADAGNKAFIVNRVADFGMVLGIFTVWMLSGLGGAERTFVFSKLSRFIPEALASGLLSKEMAVTAALLVFCGVVGKSAQFPLYIWLPDAMEGPTPVSALIHAATMVAAGVYLMARSFFLVAGVQEALTVIAYIGAVTALLAAVLALVQNDIKKILAYSTISQLGYMVLALGLGSSDVAMYHLTTHAFFKALLFLAAGAMIHHLHTQDIWDMGGLLKRMPVTSVTFLIGTLALCGIYPFSGFFSKDEILTLAYHHHLPLYVTALFTAGLTAFYMSRATWVAVLGPQRAKKHTHGHEEPGHAAHGAASEAPFVMKAPLVVLAVFSAAAGFIGIPQFLAGEHAHAGHLNLVVAGTSTIVALAGILVGTAFYANLRSKDDPVTRLLGGTYHFIVQKYYLDDFFYKLADVFQKSLAKVLFWFDWNVVITRGVNGTAGLTARLGSFLRRAQTGHVQTYAMVFGFGLAAILYFVMRA
jgi:NADH-quinone oxidoreductase subunit L